VPALDVVDELGGQVALVEQLQERQLGVHGGEHDGRRQLGPALQHDPGHGAVLHGDVLDGGLGADLDAERPRRAGHGRREAAHAPFGKAPRPEGAGAPVAHLVMGHDEGGAR
jgi:hypothetical protein